MERVITVAGPTPIALADMLRAAAAYRGRRLRIVPIPTAVLIGAAWLLATICNKQPFSSAELRRAGEDKAYDIEPLRRQLGVEPRAFAEGLRDVAIRHPGQIKLGCREQSAGG